MIKKLSTLLAMALLGFSLTGCTTTTSDQARYEMKQESEMNCGVMRTVSAYSTTGELIGQWHGMIDVEYTVSNSEYSSAERVDVVIFDGDKPIDRIIISGATVIVDND